MTFLSDFKPRRTGAGGQKPASVEERVATDRKGQAARAHRNVRAIVLLYLFFSGWWVLFTDRILYFLPLAVHEREDWSIYKGYLFVFFTGLLLYLFARRLALEFDQVNDLLRVNETKYRALVDHSPDAIYINRGGRVVFLNAAALRLFGAKDESQILGKMALELYHPDFHPAVVERNKAIGQGHTVPLVSQKIVRLDGSILDVDVSAVSFLDDEGPAAAVILRDITQRILQEREIRRLTRIYAVLSQVNQTIIRIGSRAELFQEVCRIVIEDGGFRMAWVGQVQPDTQQVLHVTAAGTGCEVLKEIKIYASADRPEGRGIVGVSIREGRAVATNDYATDPCTQPWWPVAEKVGFKSAVSLPICNAGKVCAILMVLSGEKDCFQSKEINLLEEVSLDISFALDHMDQEALGREAQMAFQKSEEQLRLLVEHLQAGVIVHAPDTRILMANPEAARLLGIPKEELKDQIACNPLWHFTDEAGVPLSLDKYPVTQVIATRQALEQYIMGIEHGKGGRKTWVLVNAYPEFDVNQELSQVVVTFVDMTERKQMFEALTASEEKFRLLFDASRDAIVLLDHEKHLDANPAAIEMFGCSSKAELCNTKIGDLSALRQPDGRESVAVLKGAIENAFQNEGTPFEWMMQRMDGTPFPAEISISVFEFRGERVLQAVIRDISWRKQAEQHLRQLSRAVEQSPSTVVITDTLGNIEYVNPKFTAITGYTSEEAMGQNPRVLKSGENGPDEYKDLWKTITAGHEWRGVFHNKKKNGELFWESASISPITDESGAITHFLAVKEDITERKLMEEKILRSQRMESIGALAGGMAHDLNNILAPIMMSASMLREEHLSEEVRAQLIAGVEDAVQRGADIVNQVLTFARGAKGKQIVLNAQALARQVGKFVKETFPKSITFSLDLPETLWNITGDPTQLYQVLLNLCVNARDAMPGGGTLRLKAENFEICGHSDSLPDAKPGRYVKMTVSDTGSGIAKEIADRIFEPFFTTKEPGKGTGLGLSTVIGILRSHGGFVTVDSEMGQGAVFNVWLPATTEAAAPTGEALISAVIKGRGETILIVDDEVDILGILQMVLEQNGWKVLCATDGVEALASYLNNSEQIKAVLTDLMMPNMDGLSLIRAIRKLDSRLPILVASGYGNESSLDELTPLGVEGFLKKPFNARIIQSKIAEVLYGKPV
jgi:PAS domain S-box-containing protein